jgi:hypothetical protein
LCALYDRSGRSAWPEVASGLTPDSIQKKYAKTVVSAWIAPGCVQSLGEKKCFHTAWVMKRREQVQRNCQCASTSRQKTHQAKADRAPRFRQCLIIAPRSSTCRVELHWRLGPGADHGRMARIVEAWDRSTAPGATSRSTISSASVRLQRLRLACRSGAQLIHLATRHGRARPGHACLWTDILNPL